MAMTKKEKENLAVLERKLAEALAFRRTDEVRPDLLSPSRGAGDVTQGWQFNAYADRGVNVYQAWSSSIHHGTGVYSRTRSASQGSQALYSSKLLALRALRNRVEEQAAARLADIDAVIALELALAQEQENV